MKNHVVLNVPSPKKIKHLIDDFLLQEKIKDLLILTPDSSIPFKAFKQDYKLIHAAGGLVKNENGEMLFIFRNGKWDLPKGHIEKSEKPRNAAIREVKEETGLSEVIIRKKIGETYHTY
ncbi:MAG: NUDIX domain-containing protein [Bacteroidota bacterium]